MITAPVNSVLITATNNDMRCLQPVFFIYLLNQFVPTAPFLYPIGSKERVPWERMG